jgi:hypothetical protein
MKLNLNKPIKDLDGNIIEKITAKSLIRDALVTLGEDDKNLSGEAKYTQFSLALRITEAGDGEVELSSEEITKIKALVGRMFYPLVVGRLFDILEGK